MNDDWTKDIRQLMDGYEVKAPDGLLEDVKKSLGKEDKKAKVVPLWRYRWIAAAAAVAVVAVPLVWRLAPKDQAPVVASTKQVGAPASPASSSESSVLASTSSSSSVSVGRASSLFAQLSSTVKRSLSFEEKEGSAYDAEGSVNSNNVAATPQLAATTSEVPASTAAPTSTQHPAPAYKKRAAKERSYQQELDNYDLAYEPTTNVNHWSVGAHYGGAAGSGNSAGTGMVMMASDAAPYGVYPANMTSSDKIYLNAAPSKKKAHHKQPIKAGVSVGYRINNRWSVQTGVNYSYLSSDFTSDYEPKETQKLHYVGVPLTASYDIVKSRKAAVYVTGGGEVEKLVKGKVTTENNESHDVKEHRAQWSVKAAVGGAYHFTPSLSVYVEPGVSHHFDNHSDVENVYKDRPTSFSLNMGFRINLNEK